jgi:hypothetical protein
MDDLHTEKEGSAVELKGSHDRDQFLTGVPKPVMVARKHTLKDAGPSSSMMRQKKVGVPLPTSAKRSSVDRTSSNSPIILTFPKRRYNLPGPLKAMPMIPEAVVFTKIYVISTSLMSHLFGQDLRGFISTHAQTELAGVFDVSKQQLLPSSPGNHGALLNILEPLNMPDREIFALFVHQPTEDCYWYAGHYKQEGIPYPMVREDFFQNMAELPIAGWVHTLFSDASPKTLRQGVAEKLALLGITKDASSSITPGEIMDNIILSVSTVSPRDIATNMDVQAKNEFNQTPKKDGSIYMWITIIQCVYFDQECYDDVTHGDYGCKRKAEFGPESDA